MRARSTLRAVEELNAFEMLIGLGAGLSIFFFGVYEMTLGMREAAADKLRAILERFTKNRVSAVATGTLSTGVVGSSSIVTIMTVGLVSAGLLEFANSLGVVMGANIGTTLTSQIIAFGLTDFFGIVLVIGAVMRFIVKNERARAWGTAIMGLGFVFLGLEHIEATMATITAIIQSSSATMGVVIILAGQGAITLPAGVAIMMGAELGTCVDTLLSTIWRIGRTALHHLHGQRHDAPHPRQGARAGAGSVDRPEPRGWFRRRALTSLAG